MREALVVGGDTLGCIGDSDGIGVGLLEDARHGGKAVARVVGAAGGRGVVAAVGVGDLPPSFVEAVGAAAGGGASRDGHPSLRCGGGGGRNWNHSFRYHLNWGRSRAVCGRQSNSRTRIQGSISADIRSSQGRVVAGRATVTPSAIGKVRAQAHGAIGIGGVIASRGRSSRAGISRGRGGFSIAVGWGDIRGASSVG